MSYALKFQPAGPLFMGAFIDNESAVKIAAKTRELINAELYGSAISLTGPHNLHFTYIFLGYANSLPLNDLLEWWKGFTQRKFYQPVTMQGAATFGRKSTTVHLKGAIDTYDLAIREKAEKDLADLGLPVAIRPYKAHLTIGRFRGDAKLGCDPTRKEIEKLLIDGFGEEQFISQPPAIRLAAKNAESGLYEDIL